MSAIASNRRRAQVAVDHENREKDDFYPTPPEATEALLLREKFDGPIWEPACGDGAISNVLKARGYHVQSTDLVDRGYGVPRIDFLMEFATQAPNIVTNPPFKMATEFMRHAVELTTGKVAMFLRLACLEGAERGEFYQEKPPARVWIFSRRVTLYRNGEPSGEGGGMVPFAWFVWDHSYTGKPQLGWI